MYNNSLILTSKSINMFTDLCFDAEGPVLEENLGFAAALAATISVTDSKKKKKTAKQAASGMFIFVTNSLVDLCPN